MKDLHSNSLPLIPKCLLSIGSVYSRLISFGYLFLNSPQLPLNLAAQHPQPQSHGKSPWTAKTGLLKGPFASQEQLPLVLSKALLSLHRTEDV